MSPIKYFHETVCLHFLLVKISSDKLGVYPFAKLFLYFDIMALSQALNLGSF